ncbi:MAG: rRNA maturation RNase YbeY [Proteobacteria bacterium]|nr:rRNA maturation RNase YbeY [Pseudomonadota bacterium]
MPLDQGAEPGERLGDDPADHQLGHLRGPVRRVSDDGEGDHRRGRRLQEDGPRHPPPPHRVPRARRSAGGRRRSRGDRGRRRAGHHARDPGDDRGHPGDLARRAARGPRRLRVARVHAGVPRPVSVIASLDDVECDLDEWTDDATALLAAASCADCELSLVVCSDAAIQRLNAAWRQKDQPTDVLSFPQDHEVILGDLVVSLDTCARQAAERGYSVRDEARVLLVHGLLHLLGYDHETGPDDLAEMAEAERKLMRRLGWIGEGLIGAAHQGD